MPGVVAVDPYPTFVDDPAQVQLQRLVDHAGRHVDAHPIPAVAVVIVPVRVLGPVLGVPGVEGILRAPVAVVELRLVPLGHHAFVEPVALEASLQRQLGGQRALLAAKHLRQFRVTLHVAVVKIGMLLGPDEEAVDGGELRVVVFRPLSLANGLGVIKVPLRLVPDGNRLQVIGDQGEGIKVLPLLGSHRAASRFFDVAVQPLSEFHRVDVIQQPVFVAVDRCRLEGFFAVVPPCLHERSGLDAKERVVEIAFDRLDVGVGVPHQLAAHVVADPGNHERLAAFRLEALEFHVLVELRIDGEVGHVALRHEAAQKQTGVVVVQVHVRREPAPLAHDADSLGPPPAGRIVARVEHATGDRRVHHGQVSRDLHTLGRHLPARIGHGGHPLVREHAGQSGGKAEELLAVHRAFDVRRIVEVLVVLHGFRVEVVGGAVGRTDAEAIFVGADDPADLALGRAGKPRLEILYGEVERFGVHQREHHAVVEMLRLLAAPLPVHRVEHGIAGHEFLGRQQIAQEAVAHRWIEDHVVRVLDLVVPVGIDRILRARTGEPSAQVLLAQGEAGPGYEIGFGEYDGLLLRDHLATLAGKVPAAAQALEEFIGGVARASIGAVGIAADYQVVADGLDDESFFLEDLGVNGRIEPGGNLHAQFRRGGGVPDEDGNGRAGRFAFLDDRQPRAADLLKVLLDFPCGAGRVRLGGRDDDSGRFAVLDECQAARGQRSATERRQQPKGPSSES